MMSKINRNNDADKLIYYDTSTQRHTSERSYAIYLLKQRHIIYVYRNMVRDDSVVEIWDKYLPKNNRCYHYGKWYENVDVSSIVGDFWDKHSNHWVCGCMPATQEILYLKNYRME